MRKNRKSGNKDLLTSVLLITAILELINTLIDLIDKIGS